MTRPTLVHGFLAAALAATAVEAAAPPRAEIQVALCEPADALERKLALRARGAAYQTWLFDDAALSLLQQGVRMRLRVKGDASELTLKVARQDCHTLDRELVPAREGKCEFDLHGDRLEGAVSLSVNLTAQASRDLLDGRLPLAQAVSPAQVRYLRDVVRLWPLPEGLRPLGPIANRVYTTGGPKFDVDVSTLPGGERYAEIATKVTLEKAGQAQRDLDAYLRRAQVTACADQDGQAPAKLRKLLEPR